jgi:hypothetical protein
MRVIYRTVLIAGVAAIAACETPTVCAGVGIDGILVEVVQPSGESALGGATIIARDGIYADTVGPVVAYPGSPEHGRQAAALAANRRGLYTVTVTKPFWTSAEQEVRVPGHGCYFVETQNVSMEIALLPDAPEVRSVAVAPRFVKFGFCGSGAEGAAFVEANEGVPSGVLWRSANENVATVDDGGLVLVRSQGITEILAKSVADTTVVGRMVVEVVPTCP